jgi:hypothetical protein
MAGPSFAPPVFEQGESAMQLTSAVYLLVEAAPTDVSPIIKAVTDPFSLLALIVLVLGLIATKWVPGNRTARRGRISLRCRFWWYRCWRLH